MCGITGYIEYGDPLPQDVLETMVDTLHHRGPNDRGVWHGNMSSTVVGLGHTRLSILDLSTAARQPMHFRHFSLVYNGEIYNFQAVRKQLRSLGHRFKTQSDTEVILHAFAAWGPACVHQFVGMFAFVILDQKQQRLYAFRDRAGVKPFYYALSKQRLIFGSELKALHAHPKYEDTPNLSSLHTYFDIGYIPGSHSVYRDTKKLLPGHYLEFDLPTRRLTTHRYWNPRTYYAQDKLTISYRAAKDTLHELLKDAFQLRMVSDVPVGVFLSGGYDSTAVTALLQHTSNTQIKTFTIGFEQGNNEAPYARDTAAHMGTDHHEYLCTTTEAQEIIPKLPYIYDEPYADSSAIPTVLVSRYAQQHVTVALSADGGDETFAGYHDYGKWRRYQSRLARIPRPLKGTAAMLATIGAMGMPKRSLHRQHQLDGVAASLRSQTTGVGPTLYEWMRRIPRQYQENLFVESTAAALPHAFNERYVLVDNDEHPMLADYLGYLPDDILVKVDRATMSTSLEGREPLLDHRIFEFAARLPLRYKVGDGTSKRILKDIVHDYVPKSLLDRPKRGFSIPLNSWLRGDLNELMMDTLHPKAIRDGGILNPIFVEKRLKEFNAGQLHYDNLVWKLLMFQLWFQAWR